MKHIRVIVADDHRVVLAAVEGAFDQHDDIKVVGTASDSTGVVGLLSSMSCDVLVTDYEMPGGEYGDGLPYLKLLQNRFSDLKIIVFTMSDIRGIESAMTEKGHISFIQKSAGVDSVVSAVRGAMGKRVRESEEIKEVI